jgi:hypothetical protein
MLEILLWRDMDLAILDISPEPRCAFLARLGSEPLEILSETPFLRGDANQDGSVDISDVVVVLGYLFLGSRPSACPDAADVDDSGELDLADPISALNYLFNQGSVPPPPGPSRPGVDPTPDTLGCRPPE